MRQLPASSLLYTEQYIDVSLTLPVHLTLLFLGEGFCRVAGVFEVRRVGSLGIKAVWGVGI